MAAHELMRSFGNSLRRARWWIVAQFVGFPLIVLAGIAWTRIAEKDLWQVVLTFLIPLLLLSAALVLKAGTMRSMIAESEGCARLVWGTLMLLAVMIAAWFVWTLLNHYDDRIDDWASLLNSKFPAWWRGHIFTYPHLSRWLRYAEWLLRWVVLPAVLVPIGAAVAVHGWRPRWVAVLHVIRDWRWLLAVFVLALTGVGLTGNFFNGVPHGSLNAQAWAVVLKLIDAYLITFICWILLLMWVSALLSPKKAAKA